MKGKFNLRYWGLALALSMGLSLIHAGQPSHSAESYDHYLRALMLESQGNFVSAMEELDRALELAPDSAYLHRTRAELSLRLGNVQDAANSIEKANDLDPDDIKALILAGQIHWAMGDNTRAEQKLKKAVDLDPDESEAIISLAGTLTAKKPEEAIKLYKEFLTRHPGEIGIMERLAQLYQNIEQSKKAKDVWDDILELAPSYQRAHLALAQMAEVVTDTTTAISHYEAVLQDDPDNLALLLRVGELRYRNNDMAKAYEAFSRAQSIAPNSSSANFWLALLSENRGDWNEAIRLLEQVRQQGIDPGVLLRLSYYYSQAGRFKEAISTLKELSDTQPNNAEFLGYLAVAYEQNKQYAAASKVVERIIQIRPKSAEAYYHLATLNDRLGQFPKAEENLKKAISLKSDYHTAMNYLGYSYADRDIHLGEAEHLLTSAIALEPQNAAYMDSMGWLYYRQGKLQRASDFLREASLRAEDPVVWDHLATVQAAQGELVDAMLSWDEGMRLDPELKIIRPKIDVVMKKLNSVQKTDLYIRRANIHFSDLRTIQGLCKITVCENKQPCFESKAQILYNKDQEMLVEIPGPLSGPVMQLRKKHGSPAQYGALHPLFQTVEFYVTRAFDRVESVLSSDAFRLVILNEFAKNAVEKKGVIKANDGIVSIAFRSDDGHVEGLEWIGATGGDLLKMGAFHWFPKEKKDNLPAFMEWTDAKKGFRIRIDFLNPVVAKVSQVSNDK